MEGFPSGQREQTVNLPAKPTEVRTLPPPPYDVLCGIGPSVSKDGGVDIKSGSSSVARASAFQAEGRGFESRFPLQIKIRAKRIRYCAHVAQLVEHILGKDEVTSSILVVGSS